MIEATIAQDAADGSRSSVTVSQADCWVVIKVEANAGGDNAWVSVGLSPANCRKLAAILDAAAAGE